MHIVIAWIERIVTPADYAGGMHFPEVHSVRARTLLVVPEVLEGSGKVSERDADRAAGQVAAMAAEDPPRKALLFYFNREEVSAQLAVERGKVKILEWETARLDGVLRAMSGQTEGLDGGAEYWQERSRRPPPDLVPDPPLAEPAGNRCDDLSEAIAWGQLLTKLGPYPELAAVLLMTAKRGRVAFRDIQGELDLKAGALLPIIVRLRAAILDSGIPMNRLLFRSFDAEKRDSIYEPGPLLRERFKDLEPKVAPLHDMDERKEITSPALRVVVLPTIAADTRGGSNQDIYP